MDKIILRNCPKLNNIRKFVLVKYCDITTKKGLIPNIFMVIMVNRGLFRRFWAVLSKPVHHNMSGKGFLVPKINHKGLVWFIEITYLVQQQMSERVINDEKETRRLRDGVQTNEQKE